MAMTRSAIPAMSTVVSTTSRSVPEISISSEISATPGQGRRA